MKERFRINCAYIFVLSILLCSLPSYCCPESVNGRSSNIRFDNEDTEERLKEPIRQDFSIEEIFQGPKERHDGVVGLNDNVQSNVHSERVNDHVRIKRDNPNKVNHLRNGNEAAKTNDKRSINKFKSGRSSRDTRKSNDKVSNDNNGSPIDQELKERSDYSEEAEDQAAESSKSKETEYKANGFRIGDDSERFTDQEERYSLYDDFEAKDVVKRGISGAEDYEEIDDKDEAGVLEDTVAVQERESMGQEADGERSRGDVRVKRDRNDKTEFENEAEDAQASGKDVDSMKEKKNEARVIDVTSKRDAKAENREDSNDLAKQDKGDAKINLDAEIDRGKQFLRESEKSDVDSGSSNLYSVNERGEIAGDRKLEEDLNSLSDKKLLAELSSPIGVSKIEEARIVELSSPNEPSKVEGSIIARGISGQNDLSKFEESKGSEAEAKESDLDGDYEKRVEEQIQRKIDSIKEEIKREIEDKRRIREIRANNAKFDELRNQEDEDEEQHLQGEQSEKRRGVAKRSAPRSSATIKAGNERYEKRSTRRKKRQDEMDPQKIRSAARSDRSVDRRRRSSSRDFNKVAAKAAPIKKREYARQVIVVKNDSGGGKKRRRRRSRNVMLIPEQASVKIEENLPADLKLDSNLRRELAIGKSSASSMAAENEKNEIAGDALSGKQSDSVASLTGSAEELGPRVATDYGEAFGGLQNEPGVALGRFKRIKRVLHSSARKN